jgi:hypothetical protein
MTTPLGPRTIRAYRRLAKPLSALVKVTRSKQPSAIGAATIASGNRVISAANRLLSRESEIGAIPLLPSGAPLTMVDLTAVVDELMLAVLLFEERHPELERPAGADRLPV